MNTTKIKIYMVGAGPGDPELLTRKAYRLIQEADVILHDDLVSEGIRELFPEKSKLYNVGKRYADGKDQSDRLQEIIKLITEYSTRNAVIVRLKGGDPMIFSRSVEEIDRLTEYGLQVELVPGITSGVAAGNTAQIPLTERSESEGIMMVTGSTLDERTEHLKTIVQWILLGNTVLLYMGFKRFSGIRELMYSYGMSPDTPASAVSKVSLPDERSVVSTVANLPEVAETAQIAMPVMIIIGKRVRKLNA